MRLLLPALPAGETLDLGAGSTAAPAVSRRFAS